MHSFDASSIIYAWDNYPLEQFPKVWQWIANRIGANNFTIPRVALDEVGNKSPDCKKWLTDAKIKSLPVTNSILMESMRIKGLLGISNDQFHPNGVGENDILIVATAKIEAFTLVSDEQKQPKLPQKMEEYKIPAV